MYAKFGLLVAQSEVPKPQGTGMDTIMFLVMPMLLFVLFIVLPMRRENRNRRMMVSNLKKGDRVLINGCFIGTISQIVKADKAEDELVIRGEENSKYRVLRSSVTRILKSEEAKEGS